MLNPGITLGQVIHGLLWELSFHGSPASRKEESAKLKCLANEVHTGEGITHRAADLFAGYKATLASCFIDTVGCALDDLYDTLVCIDDHDNAEAAFQEKLRPNIRLKPQFSGMTGMELRGYVRMNSDITF
ncbi:MAG: hypothetical protein CVU15_05450 [Betaproteobacteria bacterium HGW-Betaproteobacteria-1]|jgi:hypothetical protein|nr:MAG: hypothetical protein CVU15_05450 [Betaproteobacteria bacterium HGW-Betaproteobacteria-1]